MPLADILNPSYASDEGEIQPSTSFDVLALAAALGDGVEILNASHIPFSSVLFEKARCPPGGVDGRLSAHLWLAAREYKRMASLPLVKGARGQFDDVSMKLFDMERHEDGDLRLRMIFQKMDTKIQ